MKGDPMPDAPALNKPFVCVHWHDAADKEGTWTPHEDVEEFATSVCLVVSWGWLVRETKAYVTLAADYIEDHATWGRITKVPRGMIVKMEVMKPKRKAKA
jgi:hypothetical protein